MVPLVGFEPTRAIGPADFKSAASANSSHSGTKDAVYFYTQKERRSGGASGARTQDQTIMSRLL